MLGPVIQPLEEWPTDVRGLPESLWERLAQRLVVETGVQAVAPIEWALVGAGLERLRPGISCKLLATDAGNGLRCSSSPMEPMELLHLAALMVPERPLAKGEPWVHARCDRRARIRAQIVHEESVAGAAAAFIHQAWSRAANSSSFRAHAKWWRSNEAGRPSLLTISDRPSESGMLYA